MWGSLDRIIEKSDNTDNEQKIHYNHNTFITVIFFKTNIRNIERILLYIPRDKKIFPVSYINNFQRLMYNKCTRSLRVVTTFDINFLMKYKNTSTFV